MNKLTWWKENRVRQEVYKQLLKDREPAGRRVGSTGTGIVQQNVKPFVAVNQEGRTDDNFSSSN